MLEATAQEADQPSLSGELVDSIILITQRLEGIADNVRSLHYRWISNPESERQVMRMFQADTRSQGETPTEHFGRELQDVRDQIEQLGLTNVGTRFNQLIEDIALKLFPISLREASSYAFASSTQDRQLEELALM